MSDGNWLQEIFNRQQELEDTYGPIEAGNGYPPPTSRDIDDPYYQRYLEDAAHRCTHEIGEAIDCLKNRKPWKLTRTPTDRDHYYEEIADAFHFFIRLCIHSGMTAEDLYNQYFHKSNINKNRQESGY